MSRDRARGATFGRLENGLLQAGAHGRLDAGAVARRLAGRPDAAAEPEGSLLRRVLSVGRSTGNVRVSGMQNVMVRFAKCCARQDLPPLTGWLRCWRCPG